MMSVLGFWVFDINWFWRLPRVISSKQGWVAMCHKKKQWHAREEATRLAALVSSGRRVGEYSSSFLDLEDYPYLENRVSQRDKLPLRRAKITTHN